MNVCFLQIERSPNVSPHITLPLLAGDLRRTGVTVEKFIVNGSHLSEFVRYLQENFFDVIAFDSVIGLSEVDEIRRASPESMLVVGGVNALPLFLEGRIDFAFLGPGRTGFNALLDQLRTGKKDFSQVPNLFYQSSRETKRLIKCSEVMLSFDLNREVLPFEPDLDWRYYGPSRLPDANFRLVSVVAEFGCVRAGERKGPAFELKETVHFELDSKAKKVLADYFRPPRNACSFCAFCFQDFVSLPIEETVDLLISQIDFLEKTYGTSAFSIESESPFRFLPRLLEKFSHQSKQILLRSRVDIFMNNQDIFEECLSLGAKKGIKFVLKQVGLESFCDQDLALYNKGLGKDDNLDFLNSLAALTKKHDNFGVSFSSFGLITVNPWTTLETLEQNYLAIKENCPYILEDFFFLSSLRLYNPFEPIYPLILEEGLILEEEKIVDIKYRLKDRQAEKVVRAFRSFHSRLRKELQGGPHLLKVKMMVFEELLKRPELADSPQEIWKMAKKISFVLRHSNPEEQSPPDEGKESQACSC